MTELFELHRVEKLPPLAWLLEFPSVGMPELFCGRSVVSKAGAFFEGAWCGDYEDFAFHLSANVFGSGARFADGEVTIVTASQNIDCVYLRRTANDWVASNSLPFLLTRTDDHLRRNDWSYGERFAAILNGPATTPATIPTEQGEVSLLFHHNARLGRNGEFRIEPKPLPPPFPDYRTYADYLRQEVAAIWANVDSPARPKRRRALVTLSSGYDSTATAALATEVGCKDALSFRLARGGKTDSGEAAAAALGLTPHTRERTADGRGRAKAEVEFLAGGFQGEELFMAAAEDLLEGRFLFSGFVGGTTWTPHTSRTDPMVRADMSGNSIGEFRLRTDFIHFPPGAIGFPRSEELDALSRSEEMRPYSIGGDYDRPIPRRLAEEAGVPRETFGHAKRAGSVHVFLDDDLWSEEARRAVAERFERLAFSDRASYRWRALRFRSSREYRRWASRFQQLFGGPRKVSDESVAGRVFARLFGGRNAIVEHTHPRNTLLHDWALSELRERYCFDEKPKT